jgi:photosystem II stability/assembly factor-like uncharacterized protein
MRFLMLGCLGLILGLAPAAFDANAATALKNPAVNENFYGLEIVGDKIWIVGYYGAILHSADRGVNWQIQSSPTHNALFTVRFVSPLKGWVSGSHGVFLHTEDGGKTWRAQSTNTTEHLLGSFWLDETYGWMVGSRGVTLRTLDGGRSWLNSTVPGDFTFSAVYFADAMRGWIAGEFGVIFTTQDGGKSWKKQQSPVEVSFASGESRNLFALLFPKPPTGYAFGLDGLVLKTRDGTRWEIIRQRSDASGPGGANHLFAAAVSGERLWAVGERGTLLQAKEDDDRWLPSRSDIPRLSLNAVHFGKDGLGLTVGNRGLVLRTEDGGMTWTRLKIDVRAAAKDAPRAP